MRRLALLGCVLACAEWRMPPTFPERAAGRPVLHEQALLGLSPQGDAAVAELLEADGAQPRLALLVFDRAGGATRALLEASLESARAASRELQAAARGPAPALAAIVAARWPEVFVRAAELGYAPRPPADPEPGRAVWHIEGAAEAGALPLSLRVSPAAEPPALLLLLSDRLGDEGVELGRVLLTGDVVGPQLFLQGGVAWLLAGLGGAKPPRRTGGLHPGLLHRGEAPLHHTPGLPELAARQLGSARPRVG